MRLLVLVLVLALVLGWYNMDHGWRDISGWATAQTAGSTSSTKLRVNLPAGIYPYPESGVLVGQGWDTFNATGTAGSCVAVEAVKLERSTYAMDVKEIQSSYSLLRTVESSVSASYKGAGVGGSASMSKSNSRQINSDAQNILFNFESQDGSTFAVAEGTVHNPVLTEPLMKAAVENPAVNDRIIRLLLDQPTQYTGKTIQLTDYAKKLLNGNPEEFRRVCGQGFVAAIHRGVRVQLLMTQVLATSAEKKALLLSLSASGYGASGSASLKQASTETTLSNQVQYRTFQEGGVPMPPKVAGPNSLLEAKDLMPTTNQLLSNPTAFRVVVIPYANIEATAHEAFNSPLNMMSVGDYYVALNDVYFLVRQMIDAGKADGKTGVVSWPDPKNDANRTASLTQTIAVYGGIKHLESLEAAILGDLTRLEAIMQVCYEKRSDCSAEGSEKQIVVDLYNEKNRVTNKINAYDKEIKEIAAFLDEAQSERLARGVRQPDTTEQLAISEKQAVWKQKQLERADLQKYVQALDDYRRRLLEQPVGPEFYMRLYWYLTQIPPTDPDFTPDWSIPAPLQVEGKQIRSSLPWGKFRVTMPMVERNATTEMKERIDRAHAALVEVTLSSRLRPWKAAFCDELKGAQLCVPDEILRSMAEDLVVIPQNDDFVVQAPPPPPRRSPHKNLLEKIICLGWCF